MATRRVSAVTRPLAGLAVAEESTGFLGRWARRKTDVLQGKALMEPELKAKPAPVLPAVRADVDVAATPAEFVSTPAAPAALPDPLEAPAAAAAPEVALTLEDVKLLTKDSDFKPFMAQNIVPEVRNAAMKKLFADPHFNVMDGLDIYIDDYSLADPIPESMLRQMMGAKFLNLFGEDDKDDAVSPEATGAVRDNGNNPTDQSVAQSCPAPNIAPVGPVPSENSSQPELLPNGPSPQASQRNHAHTDLRLQPDHAAPAPDAGRDT